MLTILNSLVLKSHCIFYAKCASPLKNAPRCYPSGRRHIVTIVSYTRFISVKILIVLIGYPLSFRFVTRETTTKGFTFSDMHWVVFPNSPHQALCLATQVLECDSENWLNDKWPFCPFNDQPLEQVLSWQLRRTKGESSFPQSFWHRHLPLVCWICRPSYRSLATTVHQLFVRCLWNVMV